MEDNGDDLVTELKAVNSRVSVETDMEDNTSVLSLNEQNGASHHVEGLQTSRSAFEDVDGASHQRESACASMSATKSEPPSRRDEKVALSSVSSSGAEHQSGGSSDRTQVGETTHQSSQDQVKSPRQQYTQVVDESTPHGGAKLALQDEGHDRATSALEDEDYERELFEYERDLLEIKVYDTFKAVTDELREVYISMEIRRSTRSRQQDHGLLYPYEGHCGR